MTRPVGIGGHSRHLDEGKPVVSFVIADPSGIDRWHVCLTWSCRPGPVYDCHAQHLSIPINHGVQITCCETEMMQPRMDYYFSIHFAVVDGGLVVKLRFT